MRKISTSWVIVIVILTFFCINLVSAVDVSTCRDLNVTNTVYDLISNITGNTDCLNITANGVTLDGHGFTVIYSQTGAGKGIKSTGYNSTTIKNVNLFMNITTRTGYSDGIYFEKINNILIDNVTMFIEGSDSSSAGNRGIKVVDVNNITINNVDIETDNLDGSGIIVDTNSGQVSGNVFIYNTFINTTGGGSSSCSCGIRLIANNGHMNNTVIENVSVYTMGDTDGDAITWDPKAGITSHINLTNVHAESLGDVFYVLTGADNCYVKDSTFIAGAGAYNNVQLVAGFGSNMYLTNVTYNQSKESVAGGKLFRKWYYKAYVNNTGGSPLNNANVTAFNISGNYEMNITTDATGFTPIGSLISYVNVAGTTTYATPHNVFASASGYPAINHSVNITLKGNFLTDFFSLDSSPPSILNVYPKSNIFYNYKDNFYFNGTATDPNGLSTCALYGNWTGTYHKNQTLTSVTSGVMFFTQKNLTDGVWNYNWWCNDSTNSGTFNETNITFIIDTTLPVISSSDINITTTQGSQTVPFNITAYTEINCNNSFYSVYKSDGTIENSLENKTLVSCSELNTSFVVTAYGDYNLTIYMRDKAGNENSTTKAFKTEATVPVVITTGGGGGDTLYIRERLTLPAENYSILTTNYNDKMDMVLAKDSKKPREKEFLILNEGLDPIEVELICDSRASLDENQTRLLNETSSPEINICDYVTFEEQVLTVSPNEDSPTIGRIYVSSPENISFGDSYPFNILAVRYIDESTAQYSKLSVTTRFPIWGLVFKQSYIPFQEKVVAEDGSEEIRTTYPILWSSLFISFILFAIPVIFLRKVFLVTGLLLGFALFIISFILQMIFL